MSYRVVIVGADFAGFNAARELVQPVGATTEVVVINSTDYFLYLPLMPQVARYTFVVIGAGYTGTEVTAQGQLLTARLAGRMPGLAGQPIRWMLLDTAPRLLPDLDPRLSKTAGRVLRRRGVEVRTGHARAAGCDQTADARRRRGSRSQASSKLADQASGLSPLVAGDPSRRAGAAHSAPRRGPIGLVPAPLAGNPGGKVRRRLRAELGLWRHLRECPRLPRSSGRSR